MDELELAWDIIDEFISEYQSKEEAKQEIGDLDDLAMEITEVIYRRQLKRVDGMTFLKSIVEEELF